MCYNYECACVSSLISVKLTMCTIVSVVTNLQVYNMKLNTRYVEIDNFVI